MNIEKITSGMTVTGIPVLIVEKKVAVAKNGKSYADLTVRDSTGTLKCKVWNFADEEWIKAGAVATISGDASTYQGEVQFTINALERNLTAKPSDFAKKSRFDVEKMYLEVCALADGISEPLTKHIIKSLMETYSNPFKVAPAATGVHNAWTGGLLEHVWSMCTMAGPLISNYKDNYKIPISADKVYFGIILHDIGKIEEYDVYNPAFPKTADGLLVNHLVLGPAMVFEAANCWFDTLKKGKERCMSYQDFVRERNHLMHILAAHHGELLWGSPVVPASLEAILVHQIDLIDSRMMHALELAEGKEGQIAGFSEKSWTNRTPYLMYNKEV
jgi:3'-5' exoribonuclease